MLDMDANSYDIKFPLSMDRSGSWKCWVEVVSDKASIMVNSRYVIYVIFVFLLIFDLALTKVLLFQLRGEKRVRCNNGLH